jgi:hypothetical protein
MAWRRSKYEARFRRMKNDYRLQLRAGLLRDVFAEAGLLQEWEDCGRLAAAVFCRSKSSPYVYVVLSPRRPEAVLPRDVVPGYLLNNAREVVGHQILEFTTNGLAPHYHLAHSEPVPVDVSAGLAVIRLHLRRRKTPRWDWREDSLWI